MTNFQSNKAYPANKALQGFFDELTVPQHQSESNKSPRVDAKLDEPINEEISQAERLFAKASLLNDLLLGSSAKALNDELGSYTSAEKLKCTEQQKNSTRAIKVSGEVSEAIENEQLRNLDISLKDSLSNKFQVLLCGIANMKIAIPLVELGGIHQISTLSQAAKQAKWCAGVFLKDNEKYTCIDASAWMKPNKFNNDSVNDHKFGLQLGKTSFLLCCNSIEDTVELSKDDINWRENPNSQPWLAGLITKEMCALIDGAHMVQDVLK
jgi:purine-binding chemotaxis protein CheW